MSEAADPESVLRALVHDLRTPVTIIGGFSELLLTRGEELDASHRREYLERIDAAVADMRRLLDDARAR